MTATPNKDQGPIDQLPQRHPGEGSGSRPVRLVPPLFSINGCGLILSGRRDHDPRTGTYVATYCIALIFIPLIPLTAYRVADAPGGGYYVVSREPLSAFARGWNLALLGLALLICGAVWWNDYTSSPAYRMAGRLREGRAAAQAGREAAAFRDFADVADSSTPSAEAARRELAALYTEKLPVLAPEKALELLKLGAERISAKRPFPPKEVVLQAACALADRCLAAEPRRALSALDAVRGLAEPKDFAARRAAMVRDGAAKRPEDPDLASELAVLLEAEKDLAGCEKLLAPLAAKLGSREGARILGGIYSAAGKFGPARDLLMPYCETRLKELHATSKELEKLQESASRAVVDQLRAGRAGDAWYRAYDKKDKAGQQAMVQEYVTKALEGDPRIGALESKLVAQARIVPVALDLGMVMLQRAQGLPADERKKELLAAEGVFLSIRGVAAQSDSYRVFYGQVLYWLGRAEEGRKLFDEYLASKGRSPESLGVVARLLREVGATSESWAMGEEAYGAEKDPARKQAAAGFMAACARDVDKEVYWLERSNAASKEIQAHLASSKGHLAERDGKDREAEEHYRRSAAIHAELPKSSAELNNAALVYLSLFRLSGKGDDYRKAAAMLEEALALSPDNSVLLGNAADVMSDRAAFDILEGRLDYRALGLSPDSGQLSYLYDDEAARDELVGRYTGSASFRKALELLKRQVLLAPRNRSGAAALLGALGWTRDEAALGELKSRLREVPLDQESYRRDALEALGGKKDAERRKALELLLARYAKAAAQPPAGKDDLTPAVAGMYLLGAEFNAFTLWNRPVDADEAVARAEKLCADRPCFASRWMVISALSCRMTRRLAAAHPGFAAALGKSGRALGGDCVLILAAEGDPGFRAAAAADPDMKRILALEQESCRRLPKEIGVWQWALRRQFAPESAKAIGDRILADRPLGLLVELNQQVSPMSAKADVDLYWLLQLRGEEAKARELLRAAAKDGVPLPEMPGK